MTSTPSKKTLDVVRTGAIALGEFSANHLADATGFSFQTIQRALRVLHEEGVVEPFFTEERKRSSASPLPEWRCLTAIKPPREQSKIGNMWVAMRSFPAFQPTLIAMLASNEELEVTVEDAARYCRILASAGYLRVLETARPPQREATYRLIKNTGRLPPRQTRITVLFDDNLKTIVHQPGEVA